MQHVRTPAGAAQADLAPVAARNILKAPVSASDGVSAAKTPSKIHQVCPRQSPFAIMIGHVLRIAVSDHDVVEKL